MGLQEEVVELRHQVERLSLFHEVGKALFSTLDLQKNPPDHHGEDQ